MDEKDTPPPFLAKLKHNNVLLFVPLIGLFVSFCLDLLKNAISLPEWMNSIIFFLVIACVALLIITEALKTHTPVDTNERRALLKQATVSISAIGLLTILGSFFIVQEGNLKQAKEELEKKQKAFEKQRKTQISQLRIALLPEGSGGQREMRQFENALSNYLEDMPVSSKQDFKTYGDAMATIAKKQTEVAWMGALSYLHAQQKYGVRPMLLRLNARGERTYHSYIVTHPDSGIRTLEDIRGKQFGFGDIYSTSGRLIPLYTLKHIAGIREQDIKGKYHRSHIDVLNAVRNKEIPVGALSSDVYYNELDVGKLKEKELIIIDTGEKIDIPAGPVVIQKDIQPYDELRIQDAFLTVIAKDLTLATTMEIGGFIKVTHQTYAPLLDIAKEINFDIDNLK